MITIDQILTLKGAGYTAADIAALAPHLGTNNTPDTAGAAQAAATPVTNIKTGPRVADIPAAAADQAAPAVSTNDDIMAALKKLTSTLQQENRQQQGSGTAPASGDATQDLFTNIINGIMERN